MANIASNCCFLLFLSVTVTIASSGSPVSFTYDASGQTVASVHRTVSLLKQYKIPASNIRVFVAEYRVLNTLSDSGVSVDLYIGESQLHKLSNFASWVRTNLVTCLPHVNIKSITLSVGGSGELSRVLSSLSSIRSVLRSLNLDKEVKVSVALPMSLVVNFNSAKDTYLQRIFGFIKRSSSFVVIKSNIDSFVEQNMASVVSRLPLTDFNVVLSIRTPVSRSHKETVEFSDKISKYVETMNVPGHVMEIFVEVSGTEDFPRSRRELANNIKTSLRDEITSPTTTFPATNPVTTPTNPVTTPTNPVTTPSVNSPAVITVPATNPASASPTNAVTTPLPIPSTNPVMVPPMNPYVNQPVPTTDPVTMPAPLTNPVTTPSPVTNPVTTYPAPVGNVPVSTPVTNPVTVASPATTTAPTMSAPAIPGQSWCVARTGTPETALQSALDYACGIGGADCSAIQQGQSCYIPNTLEYHASYAYNNYYQKNPVATSCDFGVTAIIVYTNPSIGTCIFPNYATSTPASTLPTPSTSSTATPASTWPNPPSTVNPVTAPSTSSPVTGATGTSTAPPSVLNSSSPGSGSTTAFGYGTPPGASSSLSKSVTLQPLAGFSILMASIVTSILMLNM